MSQDYNPSDYNRGGLIAFVFSMVFTFVFFIYVGVIHKGVDLREIPEGGAPVQTLAKFDPKKVENPWVSSEDMIKHGKKVYNANCVACHAADYKGLAAMKPTPRNLGEGKWVKGGSKEAMMKTLIAGFGTDANGNPSAMVSFAYLPVSDRWAVIHFIHSITENKVADDTSKLEAYAKTLN